MATSPAGRRKKDFGGLHVTVKPGDQIIISSSTDEIAIQFNGSEGMGKSSISVKACKEKFLITRPAK